MATLSPVIASRPRSSRRTAALLIAAVATLALSGCTKLADGQNAEVLKIKDTVNGAQAEAANGLIVLRNVYATPAVAGQSKIEAGDTLILNGYVFNNSDNVIDTLTSANAAGSTVALRRPVKIPPQLHRVFGLGSTLAAWQTTTPTFVGSNVEVTFDFALAGSVTMTVPVEPAVGSLGA